LCVFIDWFAGWLVGKKWQTLKHVLLKVKANRKERLNMQREKTGEAGMWWYLRRLIQMDGTTDGTCPRSKNIPLLLGREGDSKDVLMAMSQARQG
jgi:hypothetical protein